MAMFLLFLLEMQRRARAPAARAAAAPTAPATSSIPLAATGDPSSDTSAPSSKQTNDLQFRISPILILDFSFIIWQFFSAYNK